MRNAIKIFILAMLFTFAAHATEGISRSVLTTGEIDRAIPPQVITVNGRITYFYRSTNGLNRIRVQEPVSTYKARVAAETAGTQQEKDTNALQEEATERARYYHLTELEIRLDRANAEGAAQRYYQGLLNDFLAPIRAEAVRKLRENEKEFDDAFDETLAGNFQFAFNATQKRINTQLHLQHKFTANTLGLVLNYDRTATDFYSTHAYFRFPIGDSIHITSMYNMGMLEDVIVDSVNVQFRLDY